MANWLSCDGTITKLTKKEVDWLKHTCLADRLWCEDASLADLETKPKELTFHDPPEDDERKAVCAFLRLFRPKGYIVVSWAFESGPLVGGGVHFYTAKGCKVCHTGEWTEDQIKRFKKGR